MKAVGEVSVTLVETARNGYMWEVLAYDIAGSEIGERFTDEAEALKFAEKLRDY